MARVNPEAQCKHTLFECPWCDVRGTQREVESHLMQKHTGGSPICVDSDTLKCVGHCSGRPKAVTRG